MGSLVASDLSSLYLDSSLYIYFIEDNPQFAQAVEDVISQVIETKIPLLASELVLTELLTLPYKKHQQHIVDIYLNLATIIPTFKSIPVSREIAIRAAQLRAKYNLRTPDAIHLATAIECKTERFVCTDKQLKKITEITVLCL